MVSSFASAKDAEAQCGACTRPAYGGTANCYPGLSGMGVSSVNRLFSIMFDMLSGAERHGGKLNVKEPCC